MENNFNLSNFKIERDYLYYENLLNKIKSKYKKNMILIGGAVFVFGAIGVYLHINLEDISNNFFEGADMKGLPYLFYVQSVMSAGFMALYRKKTIESKLFLERKLEFLSYNK